MRLRIWGSLFGDFDLDLYLVRSTGHKAAVMTVAVAGGTIQLQDGSACAVAAHPAEI